MITVLAEWQDESHGLSLELEQLDREGRTSFRLWRQVADELDKYDYAYYPDAYRAFTACRHLLSQA